MIYELSNTGLIKIEGTDTKKFLQGQLTCNVETLTEKQSCMGAHCNPQGRIISLFYLFQFQNAYYLIMQLHMVPIAISNLKKYAVFFKTEITDVSKEMQVIGYQDSDAPLDIQNSVCIPVSPESQRFIIAGEMNAIQNYLSQQSNILSSEHWKTLNIHDGIPTIYPETSEKFLPHEINLDKLHAINFDKGCYTGQEIIARMHYKGKLKNHLYKVEVSSDSLPKPGADVYVKKDNDSRVCGTLVDVSAEVYNNKYQVLIVANETHGPLSTSLTVQF